MNWKTETMNLRNRMQQTQCKCKYTRHTWKASDSCSGKNDRHSMEWGVRHSPAVPYSVDLERAAYSVVFSLLISNVHNAHPLKLCVNPTKFAYFLLAYRVKWQKHIGPPHGAYSVVFSFLLISNVLLTFNTVMHFRIGRRLSKAWRGRVWSSLSVITYAL